MSACPLCGGEHSLSKCPRWAVPIFVTVALIAGCVKKSDYRDVLKSACTETLTGAVAPVSIPLCYAYDKNGACTVMGTTTTILQEVDVVCKFKTYKE